jgi:hypothetical protein
VWRDRGIGVVSKGADLAQLERAKHSMPRLIQELIFHPDGKLASTMAAMGWRARPAPVTVCQGNRIKLRRS